MSDPTQHPPWCDAAGCEVAAGGAHRSTATRVNLRRGQPPRLLLMLSQAAPGPVMIRMVVLGDMLINEITVSLDEAHLAGATLLKLVRLAQPPV